MTAQEVARRVDDALADAGCDGWWHAELLDGGGARVGSGSDTPVVLTSMYKVPLLVAACRQVDRGELDLRAKVTVTPSQCTPGPTGLSLFADEVTLSWRDLLRSMIAVSDNAAADVVLGRVGLPEVESALADLRLTATVVRGGARDAQDLAVADLGARDWEDAFHLLATDPNAQSGHAFDPSYVSASTPRELCLLLRAIWSDEAASAASCAFMRELLGQQVWRHRIASGFPFAGVSIAGKTGTIGAVRAEMAVVTVHGEPPIAVAVVARSVRAQPELPAVDAVIGTVARLAVNHLRAGLEPDL
ncbi:serine hydrolase [Rhodococcus sp. D2-41]|uniref:serine hydrolase n=1 Tax=Speluncibacter jeojiensis TaxID=2710754 RepID=UPI00240FD614|nr:serine hydrolase [Rhodococcus sp. D2-41]MDG3012933.1 serine hydrolase [Rhodococcus sp. D2-41]